MHKEQFLNEFENADLPAYIMEEELMGKMRGREHIVTMDGVQRFNAGYSIFRSDDNHIFQMTILDGEVSVIDKNNTEIFANEGERFILYLGKGNKITILDTDKDRQQLLVEMKEPEREFEVQEYDRKLKETVTRIQKTPGEIRKFLIGKDEVSLFMCELPSGEIIYTIEDAHESLKPHRVKILTRANIKRQGEWFFVPVNKSEIGTIKKHNPMLSTHLGGNRRPAKPHIASKVIKVMRNGGLHMQFARGSVTHSDHHRLELKRWHRVYRNTEILRRDTRGRVIVGWVD